jgi:hypothetical protein
MVAYQYVILRHEGIANPHFDIMLEEDAGSDLATWRSDEWPIHKPTKLQSLQSHRREYLTYEGELSGNRGHVKRVEAGTYKRWPQWDDPAVMDLWFNDPVTWHLWLLRPPTYEWTLEPAH